MARYPRRPEVNPDHLAIRRPPRGWPSTRRSLLTANVALTAPLSDAEFFKSSTFFENPKRVFFTNYIYVFYT
jgi:hypothetical protein